MASAATSVRVPALPAERFFQGSLLLLIGSSIATLIATGKLDPLRYVAAALAMTYKGFRWWRRKPSELSHRMATVLVFAYLVIFPLDILFFSRAYRRDILESVAVCDAAGRGAFSALRDAGALVQRDDRSRRIFPDDAGLLGDSGGRDSHRRYVFPRSVFHLSVVRRRHIRRHGNAARRKGRGRAGDRAARAGTPTRRAR